MQKPLILLSAALSILSVGLGFVNRSHLVAVRAEAADAKASIAEAHKKAVAAQGKVTELKEKLAVALKDSEKLSPQLTELQSRVDRASSIQADLQKQIAQKDTDLAQAKVDLQAKDAHISELESNAIAATQVSTPSDDVKKQLQDKDALITSIQAKLKENETQLDDLRKLETQRRNHLMKSGLEGKILAVNPSWNFVVLSLGDRNGVVNNSELLINRGGQLIGKVRITSVEPSTSVADIVVNSVHSGLSIQPGDTVIYKGPENTTGDSDSKL